MAHNVWSFCLFSALDGDQASADTLTDRRTSLLSETNYTLLKMIAYARNYQVVGQYNNELFYSVIPRTVEYLQRKVSDKVYHSNEGYGNDLPKLFKCKITRRKDRLLVVVDNLCLDLSFRQSRFLSLIEGGKGVVEMGRRP